MHSKYDNAHKLLVGNLKGRMTIGKQIFMGDSTLNSCGSG